MATAALSRSYGSQLIASLKTNSSPELHSLEEMENIPYFDIEGAFFDNQFVYDLGPLLSQNLSTYLTSIELNGDVHHLYPGCDKFSNPCTKENDSMYSFFMGMSKSTTVRELSLFTMPKLRRRAFAGMIHMFRNNSALQVVKLQGFQLTSKTLALFFLAIAQNQYSALYFLSVKNCNVVESPFLYAAFKVLLQRSLLTDLHLLYNWFSSTFCASIDSLSLQSPCLLRLQMCNSSNGIGYGEQQEANRRLHTEKQYNFERNAFYTGDSMTLFNPFYLQNLFPTPYLRFPFKKHGHLFKIAIDKIQPMVIATLLCSSDKSFSSYWLPIEIWRNIFSFWTLNKFQSLPYYCSGQISYRTHIDIDYHDDQLIRTHVNLWEHDPFYTPFPEDKNDFANDPMPYPPFTL